MMHWSLKISAWVVFKQAGKPAELYCHNMLMLLLKLTEPGMMMQVDKIL